MLFGSRLNKLSASIKVAALTVFSVFKTSDGNNFITSDGDTFNVRN